MAGFPVVRYHWVFVHRGSDSVANKFLDVPVAIFVFGVVLNYGTDIANPVTRYALVNPHVQGLLSDVHQLGNLR